MIFFYHFKKIFKAQSVLPSGSNFNLDSQDQRRNLKAQTWFSLPRQGQGNKLSYNGFSNLEPQSRFYGKGNKEIYF